MGVDPFVGVLGRWGVGFPADGRAGRLVLIAGDVAKFGLHVPLKFKMVYDLAGMQLDPVQGQMGEAGCMDAAGIGIVNEVVAPASVDDGGFFPAFGQGDGGIR